MTNSHKKIACPICQKEHALVDMFPGELVGGSMSSMIQKGHPAWKEDDLICPTCLNHVRAEYVGHILKEKKGELAQSEKDVVHGLERQEILTADVNAQFARTLTFGERMSDKLATIGGSWSFVLSFSIFLAVWMGVNIMAIIWRPFDPYPFILLNLMLSALAALQAPVIMMSQRRQESKDRQRGEDDYRINLKAEMEIRMLNEKVDHLIMHLWQKHLGGDR